MLDKLPAWARHLGIVTVFAFVGYVLNAILQAGGVSGLNWGDVLARALDMAAITLAAAALVLIGTPVTRQYGVGAAAAPVAAAPVAKKK